MNRIVLPAAAIAVLAACQAPPPATPDFGAVFTGSAGEWVDLTYPYSEETIYWPTADGFHLEEVAYGDTEGGWFYSSYNYSASEHGGTHFDAPIHFSRGADTNERVPLTRLIGAAAVVDVSGRATPDYLVSVEDLLDWESRHGPLPDGAILLLRTGWGERWPDPLRYLGTELKGPEAVAELHFPGLAPEAAQWLVDNRNIASLGIDTPSIDYGQSATFETHQILYGRNLAGFENVANLEALPEWGAYVVALPMKIQGGSGGPLRIVAFIPHGGAS
ncbi:MAG: cyclase family protein [Longimicrobiales bacterium]